jgi:hypothetical protein
VDASHPFAASPSQSAHPASHAPASQTPDTHDDDAFGTLHALPHAPQFAASDPNRASQPSSALPLQSPKPRSHEEAHAPARQKLEP